VSLVRGSTTRLCGADVAGATTSANAKKGTVRSLY
jgi:hypothetical protein